MEGCNIFCSRSTLDVSNKHNSIPYMHTHYFIIQHCTSFLNKKPFPDFLFSCEIISHVTPTELNVCVSVVFYTRVLKFLPLKFSWCFMSLNLFLMTLMLSVTFILINLYLILFHC